MLFTKYQLLFLVLFMYIGLHRVINEMGMTAGIQNRVPYALGLSVRGLEVETSTYPLTMLGKNPRRMRTHLPKTGD